MRRAFPYSKWGAEVNARITPAFFTWLVSGCCRGAGCGWCRARVRLLATQPCIPARYLLRCHLQHDARQLASLQYTQSPSWPPPEPHLQVGPMKTAPAEVDGQQQMSAVKIERCRYLAESGCAAMCVNLCKAPVQVGGWGRSVLQQGAFAAQLQQTTLAPLTALVRMGLSQPSSLCFLGSVFLLGPWNAFDDEA